MMLLYVGLGGILGAIARFLLGKWITSSAKASFPLGTWIINISGSYILGSLAILHINHSIPDWLWFIIGVGFIGAYTTFSTFGYETIQLLKKKDTRKAILYVSTSVIFGVVFAWIGSLMVS